MTETSEILKIDFKKYCVNSVLENLEDNELENKKIQMENNYENEKNIELPTEPITKAQQELLAVEVAKQIHPDVNMEKSSGS